ncbi:MULTISPECIES: hotdog fold domain-containing protein [unclassified Pseudoalteromonas]|uniref:hotdog fold domain-containing protein n=1 Tax=unclassified Pseudoalteromonas TaxID=194690 RepID=UPI00097899A3|nr:MULTISPECIES: hotdog fold domain-containing protein [unclassified Pseudoalteromonas]MDN3487723.1 hotdog fold domain-containing protein [Pseudoalteromonas sp. APC 3694]
MSNESALIKTWHKFKKWPCGNWLFSKAVCFKAPYFGSMKPTILDLKAGHCSAVVKNTRRVHNHIGTIHAIAQCNLAELCAGVMVDATVPHKTHRWIPKGMTVQYLAKVDTDVTAIAEIELPHQWIDKEDLVVPVKLYNIRNELVFTADITMYITKKK